MPTIFESIGVESNIAKTKGDTSLFLTDSDERIHIWHTWNTNPLDEYTYKITGSGRDFNNWTEIKHVRYNKGIMN